MRVLVLLCVIHAAIAATVHWASSSTSIALEAGRVFAGVRVFNIYDLGSGNVRIITGKENGEFVRPDSFQVYAGYACKFYSESTRGIGYLIGQFQGPNSGEFGRHYVAFYECFVSAAKEMSNAKYSGHDMPQNISTREEIHEEAEVIPCGFVREGDGSYSLNETGKHGSEGPLASFAYNGVAYTPCFFHVTEGCMCTFYSASTLHGRAVRILGARGGQEGTFREQDKPALYECWRGNANGKEE